MTIETNDDEKAVELSPTLNLQIIDIRAGEILTNASAVLAEALNRAEKYKDIAVYLEDEKLAKGERADLNKAVKQIKDGKAEIKKIWMKPLDESFKLLDEAGAVLQTISADFDQAIKNGELERWQTKKAEIESYFAGKNFDLVPLERFCNDKWENKGYKMADIKKEIDSAIEKVYSDLKVIERIADYGLQAKAFYLDTLDMGAAMSEVDKLKAAAERIAREKVEREERERQAQIARQAAAERVEEKEAPKEERITSLADQALGLDVEEPEPDTPKRHTFALLFTATEEEKMRVKKAITSCGVPYEQLFMETATGKYERRQV